MSSLPDTYSTELGQLGLEEVEPWILEDTYENRRTLRSNGFMWDQVPDDDGLPSGLIRAFSREALRERRGSVWETRKPILDDPTNPWSDYLPAQDYPHDVDIPSWVRGRIRGWYEQEHQGVPEEQRRPLPTRCKTMRTDGTRCWNWVSATKDNPLERCKQHLGWTANPAVQTVQKARLRVAQSSLRAADILEELADNASGEAVRLKAATEILDRAGVRGGTELDVSGRVEHVDTSEEVRTRLSRLAERLDEERKRHELDVVDAEVVEDENRDHDSGDPADPGAGVVAGES